VLGDLIAKVSQMPFEEYVKVNILQPLGMTSSTHFRENVPHNLTLTPHVSDLTTHMSEIYPYNRSHAPSSTLHSSAAEMNLWAMTNLNLGLLSHAAILRSSTYSEMWNPRMTVGEPGRSEKCVGLGWFIDVYRGLQTYYHSGQDVGFSTYFILIPERSVGVTILCNATPAPVEKIAFGILDILLGIEPGSIIPSVMIQLGKVYLEGGLEAMKARYADLKESYPREYDFGVDALLETSSALLDGNHNAQAIDILNFALELFPGHAGSYEMLARAYFQSEDMKQVMHYAQRSLEIEPNNPFLRQQMGMFGSTD
jgi:CubicO group peptidase (beta-lactamase class C family)